MDDPTRTAGVVRKARAAMQQRIALVAAAARRQARIQAILAKLAPEQDAFALEYRAALAAWSRRELDDFDLIAPDQMSRPATAAKPATGKQANPPNE